jgi:acetyltransferase-like isoleucine patch superfamily enzyme
VVRRRIAHIGGSHDGEQSIVADGSVVVNDVEDGTIVVGVPAKLISKVYS